MMGKLHDDDDDDESIVKTRTCIVAGTQTNSSCCPNGLFGPGHFATL